VACGRCHPARKSPTDGRSEIVYRPIATACESCHGGRIPTGPAPSSGSSPRASDSSLRR
jgi:hypothetical protein